MPLASPLTVCDFFAVPPPLILSQEPVPCCNCQPLMPVSDAGGVHCSITRLSPPIVDGVGALAGAMPMSKVSVAVSGSVASLSVTV